MFRTIIRFRHYEKRRRIIIKKKKKKKKTRQKNTAHSKSHFLWCLRCAKHCLEETVQLEGSGVLFASIRWKWYSIMKACRNVNTIVKWPLDYKVKLRVY